MKLKKFTKKDVEWLPLYIVVADFTVEGERKNGKGYEHVTRRTLANALSCADDYRQNEDVYCSYVYEKYLFSADKKAFFYRRVLRTQHSGGFIADGEGRFLVVLRHNESDGQTLSLYHGFIGKEDFQCYI